MASSRSASFFLLLALVLVAQASARDTPEGGETKEEKASSVSVPIMSSNPSKCEWMPQCNVDKCTERCVGIGLGNEKGFCSFHNMQFECCCPIVPPRAATSSAKQV